MRFATAPTISSRDSRDGLGFDWPIAYEDVAPYYDKVEMLIGVYGSSEGLENTPDSPEGCLLPPPKARVGERLVKQRAGKLGVPIVPIHRAVLTRKLDHRRIPAKLHPGNANAQRILAEDLQARAACFWATPCGRGCSIRATYQSPTVHLPPALATGKLDILTDAMVREVTVNKGGRASGVSFIDKTAGRNSRRRHGSWCSRQAPASRCGSCSTRNRRAFRTALRIRAARSVTTSWIPSAAISAARCRCWKICPPHNEDGAGGQHVYAPWWLYQEQLKGELGFARGYHIEMATGRRMPGPGTAAGLEWLTQGSYGRKFKEDARRYLRLFRVVSPAAAR